MQRSDGKSLCLCYDLCCCFIPPTVGPLLLLLLLLLLLIMWRNQIMYTNPGWQR
jgi:hypothetical protein